MREDRVERLRSLLAEARDVGFVGPGSVEVHLEQAGAFADVVEVARGGPPGRVLDLGSGAGVPGLWLALRWEASFLLVDANGRRAAFAIEAARSLGLEGRVVVAAERAEAVGRTAARRGAFDVVTARGFGRPGVVAECAAPFLCVGGMLAVSEPPPGSAAAEAPRWPGEGLAQLGMGAAASSRTGSGYGFVLVPQERPCPERFPRRVGVPGKRPLF